MIWLIDTLNEQVSWVVRNSNKVQYQNYLKKYSIIRKFLQKYYYSMNDYKSFEI